MTQISDDLFQKRLKELREAFNETLPAALIEEVNATMRNMRAVERRLVRRGLIRQCRFPAPIVGASHSK